MCRIKNTSPNQRTKSLYYFIAKIWVLKSWDVVTKQLSEQRKLIATNWPITLASRFLIYSLVFSGFEDDAEEIPIFCFPRVVYSIIIIH